MVLLQIPLELFVGHQPKGASDLFVALGALTVLDEPFNNKHVFHGRMIATSIDSSGSGVSHSLDSFFNIALSVWILATFCTVPSIQL